MKKRLQVELLHAVWYAVKIMIKSCIKISALSSNVFDYISQLGNFTKLFESKYEITYSDDGTPPHIGKITTFNGGTQDVQLCFEAEIVTLEADTIIARQIRYLETKINEKKQKIEMPVFVIIEQIIPQANATKLCIQMKLVSKHSFFYSLYIVWGFIREYSELRRYLSYVKENIERS